jgi:hypothetical protein
MALAKSTEDKELNQKFIIQTAFSQQKRRFFVLNIKVRDSNPFKSSVRPIYWRRQMAIHPNPDRNTSYMFENWGTTKLITDYSSLMKVKVKKISKKPYNVDYCEYFEG